MQSLLLCVLGIALSVASVPIANYSAASSLYAALPTRCPDDRALRRHIHSIPPQYSLWIIA